MPARSTVEDFRELALMEGAVGFGVTNAEPFTDAKRELERRSETGERGHLGFTYRDPETATDVRRSYPWAKSLLVVAVPYLPDAGSPSRTTATGRIARFATTDNYVGVRRVLERLAGELVATGHQAAMLTDDNRLVDRAAAVRAGVGWWGKSTLVLVPAAGPWVLLGTVVTDAGLAPTEPMVRTCGSCVACIDACPTGAIVAPGVLDARKCIAHWAQVPGMVPDAMRRAMGDRVYGCDDCLDACPPGIRLLGGAVADRGAVRLMDILGSSDSELLKHHGHFYMPKRRTTTLRRNALIAAGNAAVQEFFDVVAGYTGHPDAVLRAHAVWALNEIDAVRADSVLRFVAATESDGDVLEELRLVGVL